MLELAIKSALEAGREILKIYHRPVEDVAVELKADRSPLTAADRAAHSVILKTLTPTGIPVLSEEGKEIPFSGRKNWEKFWLVDPLDGTKEFIKRNGEFTVNIALIEAGKPVLGVVYIPVFDTLFFAIAGEGAWKLADAGQQLIQYPIEQAKELSIKLPVSSKREKYTVVSSRSHMNPETEDYILRLEKKHGQIEMIASGSSIKICLVAEGAADEYPRFGPTMEWDTAAGHAIANAAGKKLWLTDFSGELTYNKENLLNPFFVAR